MKSKILFTVCAAALISGNASAQKTPADYMDELKAAGYPEMLTVPYSKTKKNYAFTALSKIKEVTKAEKKDVRLHFANISPTKEGADMLFKMYRDCNVSEILAERVILVSGQKINTYYKCTRASTEIETQEVYLVKSPEANAFVKKEFLEKDYVIVYLGDLPVPFRTEGFAQALAQWGGKAL